MPCYGPLPALQVPNLEEPGKSIVKVLPKKFYVEKPGEKWLRIPCGQCIGCRLERSRRWAVRLMHEAREHDKTCFITLTYDDAHVPKDGSLVKKHFQDFMKRLRRGSSGPLRYFHCGEYGELTARPHYHACLFGEDFFSDRRLYKTTARGDSLWESPRLSRTWGMGYANFGDLTFESAAYVARYCLKKVTGPKAASHYGSRLPEYVTMSRRPGIGASHFSEYWQEMYYRGSVVMRGHEMLPPPYYDKLLEKVDPNLFVDVKFQRELAARGADPYESSWQRLRVKRLVKEQTVKHCLERKL